MRSVSVPNSPSSVIIFRCLNLYKQQNLLLLNNKNTFTYSTNTCKRIKHISSFLRSRGYNSEQLSLGFCIRMTSQIDLLRSCKSLFWCRGWRSTFLFQSKFLHLIILQQVRKRVLCFLTNHWVLVIYPACAIEMVFQLLYPCTARLVWLICFWPKERFLTKCDVATVIKP